MTSPAGSKGRGPAAGFSLVELLAVVAIMGILAGVAAMSLRGLRTPALSSAANEVASAVKMTRQMAIASGRTMYLVFPVRSNALTTNSYRTYAIFEEVKPGQEMRIQTSDTNNPYPTNTTTASWFVPQTDWRVLAEGVVISSLADTQYSSTKADGFSGLELGRLYERTLLKTGASAEWSNFSQFEISMDVRKGSNPANSLAALTNMPYIAFFPSGRASDTAGLTLVPGFTQANQVAVTDTNNYFVIEVDDMVGRIRIRTPESYEP